MSRFPAVGRDLRIPGGPDFPETPAYAALPEGARRGVVVIHEIFGRQPEIDRVVDRFAARGYAAVAPDLFGAQGTFRCLRQTFHALRTGAGPAVAHAAGVREWLTAQSGVPVGQIGLIGFCFGGGFVLGVGRGWAAISTNYGAVPEDAAVMRGLGPTIGCYGANDRLFAAMPDRLQDKLTAVDVEVETHVYEGVGHSFLTDGDRPWASWATRPLMGITHDADVAEAAWDRILTFFDQRL